MFVGRINANRSSRLPGPFSLLLRTCSCLLVLLGSLEHSPVEGHSLQSPCPNVFAYRYYPDSTSTFGYVEVHGLPIGSKIQLKVSLSVPASVPKNTVARIQLAKSAEETLRDINTHKRAHYYVIFPFNNVIPNVLSISVNGYTICTGQKATGRTVTTLNLAHNFNPDRNKASPLLAYRPAQTSQPQAVNTAQTRSSAAIQNAHAVQQEQLRKQQIAYAQQMAQLRKMQRAYEEQREQLEQTQDNYEIQNEQLQQAQFAYAAQQKLIQQIQNAYLLQQEQLQQMYDAIQNERFQQKENAYDDKFIYTSAEQAQETQGAHTDPKGQLQQTQNTSAVQNVKPHETQDVSSVKPQAAQLQQMQNTSAVQNVEPQDTQDASVEQPQETHGTPAVQNVEPQQARNVSMVQKKTLKVEQKKRHKVVKIEEDYSSEEDDLMVECGKPVKLFNHLSIKGIRSKKGQFPWAAPIFDNTEQPNPKYICGSTIITTQHLVTAAHCMFNPMAGVRRETYDIIVVPGMFNIDNFFNADLQERNVSTITIHDDYDFEDGVLLDSDIAVLKVDHPIVYNDLVRPICHWKESNNLEQLVGLEGFVSGWGITEDGNAKYPSYVTGTVVDRRSCASNLKKIITGTSRLFCADGNGSVPCTGDSGSGFVIKRGPKYYLRGIASVGQFDRATLTCAVDKYVVYTDIAKFQYWLSKVIKF